MGQQAVLVLNADFTPLRIVPWQRAIGMLLDDKAMLVEPYAGRLVRSASRALPLPAVVAMHRYNAFRHQVRFNRANVLARDGYTCQYCGTRPVTRGGRPDLAELTIDHVVPRSRANAHRRVLVAGRWVPVTSWVNVATACVACNGAKAARTPTEAGMPLRRVPTVPSGVDLVWMALFKVSVPTEWREFIPRASPWRGYWTADLDTD